MSWRARKIRGDLRRGPSSSQCMQDRWQCNHVSMASFHLIAERRNCLSHCIEVGRYCAERTSCEHESLQNEDRWRTGNIAKLNEHHRLKQPCSQVAHRAQPVGPGFGS